MYIGGTTESTANITIPAAYQPAYGGGSYDAFLVKFCEDISLPGCSPLVAGSKEVSPIDASTSREWTIELRGTELWLQGGGGRYEVYDRLGRKMASAVLMGDGRLAETANWAAGIYTVVRLETADIAKIWIE